MFDELVKALSEELPGFVLKVRGKGDIEKGSHFNIYW